MSTDHRPVPRAQVTPRPARRPPCADRVRIEALYRDFAPALVRAVAARLGWSPDRVADGCQIAWTLLLRRPDVLDGPSARGWLLTVAARACVADMARAPEPVEWLDSLGPADLGLDDIVAARDALRLVAALRPDRRRVFQRHLAGLTYEEIGAEHGITYSAVNRHMTEARAELRAAA